MTKESMKLLSVPDVARILGLKSQTLYQWKWQKKHLRFTKIGKSLRVEENDLFDFIRKSKIKAKT